MRATVLGFVPHSVRKAKRRYGRTIGQLSLCIVEVLIPLGGLPSGSQTGSQRLEPIVPIVVGSVVMFVLVVLDWAFQTASAATIPDKEPRTIVVAGNGQQVQALQQQLDAQKAEIAALRAQLAGASHFFFSFLPPAFLMCPFFVCRAPA